jgi:hypothetical protein
MQETKIHVKVKLWVVALAALAVAGGYVLYGTGADTERDRGKVITASVESTGDFHVTLTVVSSFTGEAHLVDASYQKSFGWRIPVKKDERVTVFLTAALDIDRQNRHSVECVLRENGKTVNQNSAVTRAGERGKVVACEYETTG